MGIDALVVESVTIAVENFSYDREGYRAIDTERDRERNWKREREDNGNSFLLSPAPFPSVTLENETLYPDYI